MSIREIARWILTCNREVNFRENYTVNFFARYTLPGAAGPFRFDSYFRKHRLAAAERILARFFFVGVSDQMERSMAVLRKLIRRVGLEFPGGVVPLENTSFDFRDDLTWIRPGDEVGSMLVESVREDQKLYQFAVNRLATLEHVASLAD